MKEKQCGINITEHVLQLQRVITWYRNVRYREVSLYELSLLCLLGRDYTCHKSTAWALKARATSSKNRKRDEKV